MTRDHLPIVVLKGIRELRTRKKWIHPGPIYTAVGLILVVAVLLITTISSINSGKRLTEKDILAIANNEQSIILQESIVVPKLSAVVPNDNIKNKTVSPINDLIVWPVKGDIKLEYGWQHHPIYQDWRFHPGIDIATPDGVQVKAMQAGEVASIYEDPLLGVCITVRNGKQVVTYGSLKSVAVSTGQNVQAGDVLGRAGVSRGEPYPHLHLAIKNGDDYLNPRDILSKAR